MSEQGDLHVNTSCTCQKMKRKKRSGSVPHKDGEIGKQWQRGRGEKLGEEVKAVAKGDKRGKNEEEGIVARVFTLLPPAPSVATLT